MGGLWPWPSWPHPALLTAKLVEPASDNVAPQSRQQWHAWHLTQVNGTALLATRGDRVWLPSVSCIDQLFTSASAWMRHRLFSPRSLRRRLPEVFNCLDLPTNRLKAVTHDYFICCIIEELCMVRVQFWLFIRLETVLETVKYLGFWV